MKHLIIAVWVTIVAVVLMFVYNKYESRNRNDYAKTDTIIHESVRYITRTEVKVVPPMLLMRHTSDTFHIIDSTGYNIVVPVEQKVYEDSTFRAVISGYRPSLDSIIFTVKDAVTERSIKTIEKERKKRFSIGLSIGAFATHSGIAWGIGPTITYSLFSF